FPHHENEIAQSEACTGHTMADHWFHLTHLLVDGGKMSKSKQNFYTIDDLDKAGFTGAEIRYSLISAHYRQPLNFVARDKSGDEIFPSLSGAKQALEKLAKFEQALISSQQGTFDKPTGLDRFVRANEQGSFGKAFAALENDLNTPDALGQLFSAMKSVNPDELSTEEAEIEWLGFRQVIEALGLRLPDLEEGSADVPAEIQALAEQRWQAKQDKDWGTADALRDQVSDAGWVINDGPDGFEVVPK
ncbi:MAG: cysteine--tRNA ligase, partial [Verrucomicrobiales bacterium]|nr:cysteine--tRNA ligase [Verrucomicrobiales bacterium]